MIRKLILAVIVTAAVSPAFAAQGSSDQEAACRPDVRRFCHAITEGGNFLGCLQKNRDKLRRPCRAVLESHGM